MKTKRWNDGVEHDDGTRILVCRFRPRGLPKEAEVWHEWMPQLGPSRALHAEYYGKKGPPLSWPEYRERYLAEMAKQSEPIERLAARIAEGEVLTLLCSSACTDPERCHRTLLKQLVERVLVTRGSSHPIAR